MRRPRLGRIDDEQRLPRPDVLSAHHRDGSDRAGQGRGQVERLSLDVS
jgi:hypothetical protein